MYMSLTFFQSNILFHIYALQFPSQIKLTNRQKSKQGFKNKVSVETVTLYS
jgi:hypothetical protein